MICRVVRKNVPSFSLTVPRGTIGKRPGPCETKTGGRGKVGGFEK